MCCSVAQSCLTLCNSMDFSTRGFPVLHYLPEFAQAHAYWVSDAIHHLIFVIPFSSCPQSFPASWSFFFSVYFLFYFIFKLYITVLVLPNIKMNPPQVYMCSPSWTLLPPPSPFHPSGPSQCTSPKHPVLCASNLFQWVDTSYQVAKVLKLQYQSFQWIFRVDFL